MTEQEQRSAALAGNRAKRELARSFEIYGLNGNAAINPACRVVNAATENLETALARLTRQSSPGVQV
jgi:hypothetical protein